MSYAFYTIVRATMTFGWAKSDKLSRGNYQGSSPVVAICYWFCFALSCNSASGDLFCMKLTQGIEQQLRKTMTNIICGLLQWFNSRQQLSVCRQTMPHWDHCTLICQHNHSWSFLLYMKSQNACVHVNYDSPSKWPKYPFLLCSWYRGQIQKDSFWGAGNLCSKISLCTFSVSWKRLCNYVLWHQALLLYNHELTVFTSKVHAIQYSTMAAYYQWQLIIL